jgi:SAM-dependent methyltransferase
MKDYLIQKTPKFAKNHLKSFLRSAYYYGNRRFCPVCGKSSNCFLSYGITTLREDAICPHCGSLERHRLLWLYLSEHTNLFDGKPKTMLHIAPEPCFEPRFKRIIGEGYITADLFDPKAMVKMDVTDIKYPDQSFDVIYCSHVLEYVQDDKRAMREFYRTLKENGFAILLVAPLTAEKTFEDPSIVEPKERLKAFGDEALVRNYGLDFIDRLEEAGFKVEITKVNNLVDKENAARMGLKASGEIYYCKK